MTHVDTTTSKSHRRTRRPEPVPATPEELVKQQFARRPTDSRESHEEAHWIVSRKNEAWLREYHHKWHSMNFNRLTVPPAERQAPSGPRADEALAKLQAAAAKFVYLEWPTPLGKKLGDCTDDECIALAPFLGAGLASIGRAIKQTKPGEVVRKALSEVKVKELMGVGK